MENKTDIASQFEFLTVEHPLLFIAFEAKWCSPCKPFSTAYDEVSQQFPRIRFLKVDIEQQKAWLDFLDVRSVPHLLVIKEGIVVYSESGNISKTLLIDLANQLLQLDVSLMKAKMNSA